jgi:hypothetical protein
MPLSNKGHMGILFGKFIHIHSHIGTHFRGRHIPENAEFKVIVIEGKMVDIFWGMFSLRSWSTCLKG